MYVQSSDHYSGVHRHPADGEAHDDVDHGPHYVDLHVGQSRRPFLTFGLAVTF